MAMPLQVGETTLYTVAEAAKVAGVARQTLWTAIKAGLIPTYRYAYRTFIKAEDLWEWKAKHYREDMARRKGKQQKVKATKRET